MRKIITLSMLSLLVVLSACSGFKKFSEARSNKNAEKQAVSNKKDSNNESVTIYKGKNDSEYSFENRPNARLASGLPEKSSNDTLLVSLERTSCFGECPTYSVSLYQSGLVIYNGLYFVEKKGEHKTFMPYEQTLEIIALAKATEFENFDSTYGIESADLSKVKLTFNLGQEPKFVQYNINEPEALKIFTKRFESLVNNLKF